MSACMAPTSRNGCAPPASRCNPRPTQHQLEPDAIARYGLDPARRDPRLPVRAEMPGRRVLVVPDWYPSPERPVHGLFCREHSRAAAAAGNDVVVLARDPAAGRPCIEDGIEAGVRVVRVRVPCWLGPLRTSVDLAAVAAGAAHLGRRGWRPDVVHAHVFSSGAVALPIARAARAPLVVSEHLTSITRGHLGRRDLAALRFAYRGAALVAPCSQDLARHIAQLEPRAHLEVVPNVVDGGRFHPPQPAAPAAERLLFVAFLNEKRVCRTCWKRWRCSARRGPR